MSAEVQRLLQAVEHFKARTRGAELPKGAEEALEGLAKTFSEPMPGRDTPGQRAALSVAPGATGVPMEQAAKGPDGPSPGQKAAASSGVSAEIQKAAESIVANAQS